MLFCCFFVSTSLLGLPLPPERLQPSSALCYKRQFSPPSSARDWEPLRSDWFPRMQDAALHLNQHLLSADCVPGTPLSP